LPPAATRANGVLCFNGSGAPIVCAGTLSGVTVSAPLVPFVQAPSIAAAWGVLGTIPFSSLPAGVDSNTLNPQIANYPIVPGDCGKTIQAGTGSTGQFTITLPAVAGFGATCTITIYNGDTASGKVLSGFPTSMTSANLLFPRTGVKIINGVWTVPVNPGRYKIPNNTTIYVSRTGLDTNDCLSASTPCQTNLYVFRTFIKDYLDFTGSSTFGAGNPSGVTNVFVQYADNATGGVVSSACYDIIHMAFVPVGSEGRASIVVQGNAVDPSKTVFCGVGANIGAYGGGANLQVRNLQIGQQSGRNNGGIEAVDGGNVRLEGGLIFAGNAQAFLQAYNPRLHCRGCWLLRCQRGPKPRIRIQSRTDRSE
jgi:hypothetical protein